MNCTDFCGFLQKKIRKILVGARLMRSMEESKEPFDVPVYWTEPCLTCLSVAHLTNNLFFSSHFRASERCFSSFCALKKKKKQSGSIFFLNFSDERLNELYGIYWPQRVLVIGSKYLWRHRYWSTSLVFPFGFLGLSLSLTRERDHTCPHQLKEQGVCFWWWHFIWTQSFSFGLLSSQPKMES